MVIEPLCLILLQSYRGASLIPSFLSFYREQIKQFGKRMATDSFIQCFAVVNCLLLLGVVLYAILKKGSLGGAGDDEPNSPLGLRG